MIEIDGTTIYMTRGDTLRVTVGIKYLDTHEDYIPQDGDVIRFTAKRRYSDTDPVIEKIIPNNTLLLELNPSDTKHLTFRPYVYDIELDCANGDVDTFINKATLCITEEVG